jgi:hypothetical protein
MILAGSVTSEVRSCDIEELEAVGRDMALPGNRLRHGRNHVISVTCEEVATAPVAVPEDFFVGS